MSSYSIFEKNNQGTLSDSIVVLLRDRILTEEYKDGQKLNEVALANELKTSRTPVREALKQLESEGLVISIPNKGVYVKAFTPRDIDDMFEIRIALEGLAIELAIERMDEAHLSRIQEVYDLMEFYTYKKDQDKINELNILYHETIYEATQSTYFEQVLKDIHYYVSVTSSLAIKSKQRYKTSITEHKAILDAINEGDAAKAKVAMQTHIKHTQQLVRDYYESRATS